MSDVENFQTWLKEVISKIIENLGSNIDEVEYELAKSTSGFMSTLHYVCVKYKNKTNGRNDELSLVLKRPVQTEGFTELHQIDAQFHNEILFYRMYAQSGENFARCFHVDERPPNDSVIALENVSKYGFCPSSYKCDAPLEYTLAAIREMGRFHAKGYVMKELQRERFFDIVERLQENRYEENTKKSYKEYVNINATRAVDYLRSRGHDSVFCDKMEALLSNGYDEVMVKAVRPLEPLSTLCHGDFTLGNILFKTEDDGQRRAMPIDFAFLRYSTPVIDLSTYLCLCPNVVRKDNFYDIMRVYHDALKECLLDAGVRDIEKYSYDALLDDYRRGGLFGFLIASFFLPALLGHFNQEVYMQKVRSISYEECAKFCKQAGGDEVSKILANMLLDMRDLGCLRHVL